MKLIETPQDNLREFLLDPFNIDIYDDLTDTVFKNMFNPLTFFNHLYSELDFFLTNALNYAIIKNHFKSYKEYEFLVQGSSKPHFINIITNDRKRLFFFATFSELIKKFCASTESSNRDFYKIENEIFQCSYRFILDLNEIITNSYYKDEPDPFEEVQKDLEDIPLTTDKIKYLIEITEGYKQFVGMSDDDDFLDNHFLKDCYSERKKLEKILAFEKTVTNPQNQTAEPQNQTAEPQLKTLDWKGTDKEIKLTELVKALIESGVLETTRNPKNENELTQKETFKRMMLFFNIKEFNPTEIIRTIEKRKKVGTFLTDLIKSLNNWTNKKLKSE